MSPIVQSKDQPRKPKQDPGSGPLNAKQQLDALKRVQDEADRRVKLGMQIYRAAETHTQHQQSMLDTFNEEQDQLKEELHEDLTRSLHSYDQWVGKIDEDFTSALRQLEQRIDKLQAQWNDSQDQIDKMIRRSETLLEQNRTVAAAIQSRERTKIVGSVQPPSRGDAMAEIQSSADSAAKSLSAFAPSANPSGPPDFDPNQDDTGTKEMPTKAVKPSPAPGQTAVRHYQNIIETMDQSSGMGDGRLEIEDGGDTGHISRA